MNATSQITEQNWQPALVQDFGPENLVVSTKFMESYELIRPVSGGGDISTYLNRAGNLDIYSVGTSNSISRIRQQDGSENGWLQEDLKIVAHQLSLYVPSGADADSPNVMGLNAASKLTLSTWDKSTGSYRQAVNQPEDKALKQFLATKNLDNVYANVILDTDEVATSFLKPDGTWASKVWVPVKKAQGSSLNAKAKRIAMCTNNPVQTALYAIDLDGFVQFAPNAFRFSYFIQLGTHKAADINVVQDAENLLNIFIIDTDGFLWQKKQRKQPIGGDIIWEDWATVDGTTRLVALQAVQNISGNLEIFAIGDDNRLYHTSQISGPKGKVWTSLFPLGNPVPNSVFSVGRNVHGYSEVYSVTQDNRLYRFWQDPATTQWYNMEILLPRAGEDMIALPAHSMEVIVLDFNGLPKAQETVFIRASNLCSLNISGNYYIVSEFRTVKVEANEAGSLVINYLTEALTAPTLFISTEFTGAPVEVQPNAGLQAQLNAVSADEVWNAKDASGNYLLSGENRTMENAQSIAEISTKSMSLGGPAPVNTGRLRLLGNQRKNAFRDGYVRPGPRHRINFAEVVEQHWVVDFRSGAPRVKDLTRIQAASFMSEMHALRAEQADGFLGVDWGDIWNSIKEGVGKILGSIQQFVVTTIIDPLTDLVKEIKVVFEFLIDGVRQIVEQVITFIQQAFDIIEGIWNKIKVFFKQLWEWLAFLFAWKDISRTAKAVEHTINTTMDFMVIGLKSVRGTVETGFDTLSQRVIDAANNFIEQIGGQTDLNQFNSDNEKPQPALDASTGHNVMSAAFEENYQKGVDSSTASFASAGSNLDALIAEMEKLIENFQFGQGEAAFKEAVGYFNQIVDNPDNALTLLISGVVKIMEGIALFGIALAKGIVLTIIDIVIDIVGAFKELMNEEWGIPVVSQLYKLITGQSLTFRPIALVAIIAAIPGTLFYKIVKGVAPFPDDASLERFTSQFTAQWLAEQAGIVPQARRLSAAEAAKTEEWRKWVAGVFGCVCAGLWVFRIWPDTAGVILSTIMPAPKRLVITNLIVGFSIIGLTVPWIVRENAGGLACNSLPGLSNLRWLLNSVMGPGLGAVYAIAKVPGKVADMTNTLWGAGNLALVIVTAAMGTPAQVVAEGIFTTLSPQIFRLLNIMDVWGELVVFTKAGLIVSIVLTYPTTAGLHIANSVGEEAAAANARLLESPRYELVLV